MSFLISLFNGTVITVVSVLIFGFLIAILMFILDEVLENVRNKIKYHWYKILLKRISKKYTEENPELKVKMFNLMRKVEIYKPKFSDNDSFDSLNAILERESLELETIKELLRTTLKISSNDPKFKSLLRIVCNNIK